MPAATTSVSSASFCRKSTHHSAHLGQGRRGEPKLHDSFAGGNTHLSGSALQGLLAQGCPCALCCTGTQVSLLGWGWHPGEKKKSYVSVLPIPPWTGEGTENTVRLLHCIEKGSALLLSKWRSYSTVLFLLSHQVMSVCTTSNSNMDRLEHHKIGATEIKLGS